MSSQHSISLAKVEKQPAEQLSSNLSPRQLFIKGLKDVSPVLLGMIPFALVSGLVAVSMGLPEWPALAMSFIVLAGAAQLAGVQLIGAGAPVLIVLLTTFVINLRFVMYSASLAPHFQRLAWSWKALLSYIMTDQAYAFAILRFRDRPDEAGKHWYYLGVGLILVPLWIVCSAVGIFVGAQVPAVWSLEFAVPLVFIALVFPAVTDRPSMIAALSAGIVALIAYPLPFNLNLILAAFTGVGLGLFAEVIQTRSKAAQ